MRLTFQGFCDKIKEWYTFLTSDTMKAALHFVMMTGKKLLRHILPRGSGQTWSLVLKTLPEPVRFLGVAAILYPVYQDRLQLVPVFDQAILKGEVGFSGRILGGIFSGRHGRFIKIRIYENVASQEPK